MIVAGDADLVMTRNTAWKPLVTIQQTGPQQLSVSVVQALPVGTALFGRLIPEDGNAYAPQALVAAGDVWSTVFNLPAPVSPLFLQLWVGETPLAPITRREVVADRGAGGNGAFGPAKLHTGVLVVSSDGKAGYEGEEGALIDLEVGESIAWQSMPGTPPLPPGRFIAGRSYRLDAYPPALVAGGAVSIQFDNLFGALQRRRRQCRRAGHSLLGWHILDGTAHVDRDACRRRRQRLSGIGAQSGCGRLCRAERSGRSSDHGLLASHQPLSTRQRRRESNTDEHG